MLQMLFRGRPALVEKEVVPLSLYVRCIHQGCWGKCDVFVCAHAHASQVSGLLLAGLDGRKHCRAYPRDSHMCKA